MPTLLRDPPKTKPAPKQYWSKTNINFWLDTLLLVMFLALCWSAVIVRFVFPAALRSEGWTLWGMDYQAWSDIQFGSLCLLSAGILLHVMLHWTWVCGVVGKYLNRRDDDGRLVQPENGTRTLWGVGLLIVILNVLGLGIAVAALTIQSPAV